MGDWWDIVENGQFCFTIPDGDIWWCSSLLYWYMVIYSNTSGVLYIWLPLMIDLPEGDWKCPKCLFAGRPVCSLRHDAMAIGFFHRVDDWNMWNLMGYNWDRSSTKWIMIFENGAYRHTPWNGMEYTIYYDIYDIYDLLWWDRSSTKLIWKWGIPLERDTDDEAQIWR